MSRQRADMSRVNTMLAEATEAQAELTSETFCLQRELDNQLQVHSTHFCSLQGRFCCATVPCNRKAATGIVKMLALMFLGGYLQGFDEELGRMRSEIKAVRGEKHSVLASIVEAERKVSHPEQTPQLLPQLLMPKF